jgi:hypothetical protein
MRALLRRDLSFAALLTVLGTVALATALAQEHFQEVWVFEPAWLQMTFHTAWAAGLVLGVVVALRDHWNGALDYIRHRPLSPAVLQLGRLTTAALVLVAWWVLAPAGAWLAELVGGSLVTAGRLDHWPLVFASMAPAASAAALAMLAARLPLAWWLRAVVAAVLLLVGFPLCEQFAAVGDRHDPAVFTVLHLGLAVLLGAVSVAFGHVERDPDRSWTRRVPAWATAFVLAAGVAGGNLLLNGFGTGALRNFAAVLPVIGKVGERHELLAFDGRNPGRSQRAHLLDAEHRRTGAMAEGEITDVVRLGRPRFRGPELKAPQFGPRLWSPLRIDRHGFANCLLLDRDDWTRRFCVFGRGDRVTPFHSGVRLVLVGADGYASGSESAVARHSLIWAVEPEALEVFCFDPSRDEVRSVPMPDGQRIVAVLEQEQGDPPALAGWKVPSWLVRGERGVFAFTRDGLVPAEAKAVEAAELRQAARRARGERARQQTIEFPVADVLTPTVRVLDAAGAVRFEHAYAPRTALERTAYAMGLAPSLLRSPLLQVGAHLLADDVHFEVSVWVDPVVAEGRRSWLVFANCVVSGMFAAITRRRLRRAGADARTLRFWSIAVALTGLVGALLSEWLEASRAWRVPQVSPAPAPRIHTVSEAG